MKKTWLLFLLNILGFAGIVLAQEGHGAVAQPVSVPWGLKGLEEAVNIHPLFVHFPIALLLTSTAFYFLGTIFKKNDLLAAAKWVLYFGTLSAAVTVWTGLQAAKTISHGGDIHQTMMMHQYFGFAVLGLSFLLSVWVLFSKANVPVKGKPLFLLSLLVLATVLIQGADLGGRMVFLNGVGVGRKSMAQEEKAHSHEHAGEEQEAPERGGHSH